MDPFEEPDDFDDWMDFDPYPDWKPYLKNGRLSTRGGQWVSKMPRRRKIKR